eukprot:GHVP01054306.1.p1 GENE.GHVP01054306.1~~GHVP01054306.1.p1  ORF type:complete len:131 (+),score=13.28 GHVP01054306.1:103-495(+)
MERPEEHVFQFVLSELGTDGSQGKDGLVLKGRYVAKQIESCLAFAVILVERRETLRQFAVVFTQQQKTIGDATTKDERRRRIFKLPAPAACFILGKFWVRFNRFLGEVAHKWTTIPGGESPRDKIQIKGT